MRISTKNYKQYFSCNRFYFLSDIYLKKNLSEVIVSQSNTSSILEHMFDEEGNDILSLPLSFADNGNEKFIEEVKDLFNSTIAKFDQKYEYIVRNNITLEANIDMQVEEEDSIDFYKISLSTVRTLEKEFPKKKHNYSFIKKIINKDIIKIEAFEDQKESKVLKDLAFFKYVYNHSYKSNTYKKIRYNILVVNSEKESLDIHEIIDIFDVTELLDIECRKIEQRLDQFISMSDSNILDMNSNTYIKNCKKDCKFYSLCNKNQNPKIYKEEVNKELLLEEFKKIKEPIYYLDFESYSSAKPRFVNEKPYSQHVFLYSLIKEENGEIRYSYYIADNNVEDFRYNLFKQLCDEIELTNRGTVIVYNDTFEKSRIKEASEIYIDLKDKLLCINSKIIDLLKIVKKGYKNEALEGSYSIKKVLPFFDAEGYNHQAIKNGVEASSVYGCLHMYDDEEKEQKKQELVEYCKKDTEAMYVIYEGLKKRVNFE